MSKIVIGESEGKSLKLDIELLIPSRLLIQANSGGGKCLHPSTVVPLFYGGILSVEEMYWRQKSPMHVLSPGSGNFGPNLVRAVTRRWYEGPLLQIETTAGRLLRVTPNHGLLAPEGERQAGEFRAGGFIATARGPLPHGSITLDPTICKFLAVCVAEGHDRRQPTVALVLNTPDARLHSMFQAGARELGFTAHSGDNPETSAIYAAELPAVLDRFGYRFGCLSAHKAIPRIVFELDRESLRTFLRAYYDCEGSITSDRSRLEISSASREIADGLCLLLERFGLHGRVSGKRDAVTKRLYWRVKLESEVADRFFSLIGASFSEKMAPQGLRQTPLVDRVPLTAALRQQIASAFVPLSQKQIQSRHSYNLCWRLKGKPEYIPVRRSLEVFLMHFACEALRAELRRPIFWDRIKTITEEQYSGYVYDIAVDDPHWLIANGFIVHNSWLLRRIAEQLYGKVQTIIIDPEGEFYTLREKFGYVLVGEGGETPADLRSAEMLAGKFLTLKANAVCDLYEAFRGRPNDARQWVRLFLNALLDAPRTLWHPLVVIVDESHKYCPQETPKAASMHERDIIGGCKDAMIALATTGRKRGYCAIWATQRLAKLDKDASAELFNRLVGMTIEDVDVDRAADLMSVSREEKHNFRTSLRGLNPGQFYAFGRAITTERKLVMVGECETHHPETGAAAKTSEAPPTPDAIKGLLPQLADLPKQAEDKARTEAEYKREIRDLNQKLREASKAAGKAQPAPGVITRTDPRAIQLAVTAATKPLQKQIEQFQRQAKAAIDGFAKAAAPLNAIANAPAVKLDQPALGELPKDYLRNVGRPDLSSETALRKAPPPARSTVQSNGDVSSSQQRILNALAEFDSIGIHQLNKTMLAAWCQCSPTSGGYFNNLGKLRGLGLIDYPGQAVVSITEEGRKQAVPSDAPLTTDEMFSRTRSILSASQFAILEALRQAYPESVPKSELAEKVGASPTSGGYFNNLGKLRSSGLIDYPEQGKARVEDWMFLEGAA